MQKSAVVIIGLVILAIAVFFPLADCFVFTETRSDKPASHYIRQKEENGFAIRYTHSIHLSDVVETYEATDDRKIRLVHMEYEDLAIGMPGHAEEGESFSSEDGKYKLSYENRVLDSFTLFVADIDTDLQFRYGEGSYDLKQLLDPGTSYQFEIRKLSLFDMLKGVNMNGG